MSSNLTIKNKSGQVVYDTQDKDCCQFIYTDGYTLNHEITTWFYHKRLLVSTEKLTKYLDLLRSMGYEIEYSSSDGKHYFTFKTNKFTHVFEGYLLFIFLRYCWEKSFAGLIDDILDIKESTNLDAIEAIQLANFRKVYNPGHNIYYFYSSKIISQDTLNTEIKKTNTIYNLFHVLNYEPYTSIITFSLLYLFPGLHSSDHYKISLLIKTVYGRDEKKLEEFFKERKYMELYNFIKEREDFFNSFPKSNSIKCFQSDLPNNVKEGIIKIHDEVRFHTVEQDRKTIESFKDHLDNILKINPDIKSISVSDDKVLVGDFVVVLDEKLEHTTGLLRRRFNDGSYLISVSYNPKKVFLSSMGGVLKKSDGLGVKRLKKLNVVFNED